MKVLMRQATGSVVAAALGHGVWNGGAYVLFGFGTTTGALGIADTTWFGPETGGLGLALNLAAVVVLRRWVRGRP